MTHPGDTARDIYTVARLNSEARAVLEGSFPLLWIEGEISNLVAARSGHLYFSLKDASAQVRCALFRGKRQRLRFTPSNGAQVLARVRVSFYEPRGEFQLLIEHLEPAGAGLAALAFEALKAKLQAEGLFDPARKQTLPPYPRRLGVITSPSGAAIRDVLQVLRRRAPQLPVTVFPALVQGPDAAGDLLEALTLAQARGDCDVLLITRGGGAIEDLAAFNDERLARAIAAASVPVVSAVGHEIDFTIADFVADRRAPTPSAAAELISPDSAAVQAGLRQQQRRLLTALRRDLGRLGERLSHSGRRLQRAGPGSRLHQLQQRLDGLDLRLQRGTRVAIDRRLASTTAASRRLRGQNPGRRLASLHSTRHKLTERLRRAWSSAQLMRSNQVATTARQLQAMSPQATIQRGYVVLRSRATGAVITATGQTHAGMPLSAELSDGHLPMTVDPDDPSGKDHRRSDTASDS